MLALFILGVIALVMFRNRFPITDQGVTTPQKSNWLLVILLCVLSYFAFMSLFFTGVIK